MRPTEQKITAFLESAPATVAIAFVAFMAMMLGVNEPMPGVYGSGTGLLWESANQWISSAGFRVVVDIVLLGLICFGMGVLNRNYNMLHSTSVLYVALFMVLTAATPLIAARLTGSLIVCLVILAVVGCFYSVYMRPRRTRRIFLCFAVMSALSMADYAYLVYMIGFLAAFSQMRVATRRMLLAALMGIITPWWIVLGSGIADFSEIHLPHSPGIFSEMQRGELVVMIATVGVSVIACFLLCASNMVKIYTYNARARSISGLLIMLSLLTALLTLVDFGNSPQYLATLNCLTAFQLAHFFSINAQRRSYVVVCVAILIYAIIYFLNLWT